MKVLGGTNTIPGGGVGGGAATEGSGLALGLVGAAIQVAAGAGWIVEPTPRLGLRLFSLGMVLSLVLGFGAFLVPVFLEIRDPLVIPKLARPHERTGRRALYVLLAVSLAASFVAADLVDEVALFRAPKQIGVDGIDALDGMPLTALTGSPRLKLVGTENVGADTLGYLSLGGLLSSVKSKSASYCTSCYTGNYPVAFPRDESGYLQLSLKMDGKREPLPEEEPETVV